jgi:chromate reductase, NAD(P)H dehydrogenase (quinone)
MADKGLNILGIAGSLRKGSYNKMLLNAASGLLPEGAALEKFDLEGIPIFNADLEGDMPKRVLEFKARINAADAVLIVTPEYNYSVPGVLKNAIDWASRPYGSNSFEKKPVAMMSASPGMLGGSRAQYHLRQVMLFFDAFTMVKPEVFVAFVNKKFDAEGKLVDADTEKHVREFMESFVKWSKAIRRSAADIL